MEMAYTRMINQTSGQTIAALCEGTGGAGVCGYTFTAQISGVAGSSLANATCAKSGPHVTPQVTPDPFCTPNESMNAVVQFYTVSK
jgi:hypothetical protein